MLMLQSLLEQNVANILQSQSYAVSENSSVYAGAKTGKQPLQMFEHVEPKC